jgi:hypothetical protein
MNDVTISMQSHTISRRRREFRVIHVLSRDGSESSMPAAIPIFRLTPRLSMDAPVRECADAPYLPQRSGRPRGQGASRLRRAAGRAAGARPAPAAGHRPMAGGPRVHPAPAGPGRPQPTAPAVPTPELRPPCRLPHHRPDPSPCRSRLAPTPGLALPSATYSGVRCYPVHG